jgi:hypothetical protein
VLACAFVHIDRSRDAQHIWRHRGRRACQAWNTRRDQGQDPPRRAGSRR